MNVYVKHPSLSVANGIISSFILNIKLSSMAVSFCAMYTLPFNVTSVSTVVSLTSSKSTLTIGYATVIVFCATLTFADLIAKSSHCVYFD